MMAHWKNREQGPEMPEIIAVRPGGLTPSSHRRFLRFYERLKKEDWNRAVTKLERKAAPKPEQTPPPSTDAPAPVPEPTKKVESMDVPVTPAVPAESRTMPGNLMPPPGVTPAPAHAQTPAPAPAPVATATPEQGKPTPKKKVK